MTETHSEKTALRLCPCKHRGAKGFALRYPLACDPAEHTRPKRFTKRRVCMHIYIDESGSFVVPEAPVSSISAIGALAIPACYQPALWKRYRRIRVHWPRENGEVKGRLLDESQVSGLVDMLADTPVIFDIAGMDTGMETRTAVQKHRDRHADKLLLSVGPKHRPSMIAQMQQLARRLRETPLQLYIESQLLFEVVHKILQHSMLLYSQILPRELGSFSWTFDSKDVNKLTDWEAWWKTMIAPIMQSMALRTPFIGLSEGDYTYFDKMFKMETPEWFKEATGETEQYCSNLGLILKEFKFTSAHNYGLEMVDVLTNAARRALSGNLREEGWRNISKLIPKMSDKHQVQMLSFSDEGAARSVPYASVIRKLDRYSKRLLIP
jgi:hypothetical protein